MPGVDFSRPLLGAGASAHSDEAAAQARTGLDFIGSARFKRGLRVELGVAAFADASAGLSKFIGATVEGTAFARAQAGVQLQLPLNLFDEFGFSVRAEAIAEAAVGIAANLHLNIGDFVLLAQQDPEFLGVALELLLLFLEEVRIGGEAEVNVSASAKAHASVSVSGQVIAKQGTPAGFFYTIDAGVGLAAGVGFGIRAGLEFGDFRRFYGRAVDLAVDHVTRDVAALLPDDASSALQPALRVVRPLAKIALRSAYELGSAVVERNPDFTAEQAQVLCNEALKTLLEEVQRFTFSAVVDFAVDDVRRVLESDLPGMPGASWGDAVTERTELAETLLAMPGEPFQPTPPNLEYWAALVARMLALADRLYGTDAGRSRPIMQAATAAYCGSELLLEAVRSKVNTASAYALAVGAGGVESDLEPFKGPLDRQPPAQVAAEIRVHTGAVDAAPLRHADLLAYLLRPEFLESLIGAVPELEDFISIFGRRFDRTTPDLLGAFLNNVGAFADDATTGSVDARALLGQVVGSLDDFLDDRFTNELLPQILQHVDDPALRLYLEEVLVPAVVHAKDIGLKTIMNWTEQSFDRADFSEALAGIMMTLLGRSVIVVGDTFLTVAEISAAAVCDDLADRMERGDQSVEVVRDLFVDPDAARLAAETVRVAGEILGPLPDDTRRRVRRLLYQIFEPLPPSARTAFLAQLGDDFFIPNGDDVQELADELVAVAARRFGDFAARLVERAGELVLTALEELLEAAVQVVLRWGEELGDKLAEVATLLREAEDTLRRLNTESKAHLVAAEDSVRTLLRRLTADQLRREVRNRIEHDVVDSALDVLERSPQFRDLPDYVKRRIRDLTSNIAAGLVKNPFVDPVFAALDTLAEEVGELIPECRELDPADNLPEQLMDLVLDRIEDRVRDRFGDDDPLIQLTVDFSYQVPFFGTQSVHISLGSIDLPVSTLIGMVRQAVAQLDFYHDQLNAAAVALAELLATELDAAAAQLKRAKLAARSGRLTVVAAEHHRGPQELRVLAPAPLAHYRGRVPLRIHVGGVGPSVLGLAPDEAPRVLVFLNGELRPSDGFVVEADPARPRTGNSVPPQPPVRPRFEIDLHREVAAPHALRTVVRGRRTAGVGRRLSDREIEALLPRLSPGFVMRTEVDRTELAEGINVLTAVLIEADGSREEHNVSFTVSGPTSAVRPPRGRGRPVPRPRISVDTVRGVPSRGQGRIGPLNVGLDSTPPVQTAGLTDPDRLEQRRNEALAFLEGRLAQFSASEAGALR